MKILVKILVWSALVYGAEAWTLCKVDENRIMPAEMWFSRHLLKMSWKQKRANSCVLNEFGVKKEFWERL